MKYYKEIFNIEEEEFIKSIDFNDRQDLINQIENINYNDDEDFKYFIDKLLNKLKKEHIYNKYR